MNRAELAAEVLRIHDLIAAEPETEEEWNEIDAGLDRVARSTLSARLEARRQREQPQPRMVDGRGLCSVHCSHYFRDDYTEGCKHGGNGVVARPTRSMVPCRPWVDATLQHQRDVNEAQAASWKREVEGLRCELVEERAKNEALHVRMDSAASQVTPEAMPCEHMYPGEQCGQVTVCRNTSGFPLCHAHGGRKPGEVCR